MPDDQDTSEPGGGQRQQRAAQIRAEQEAAQRQNEEAAGGEQDEQQRGVGPVGEGEYEVQEGDCLSSIARGTGHLWQTIWEDEGNSALREVRQEPNVLLPRDRLHIPPVRRKQDPGETEMRHRFVRRGEPTMLRLRLLHEGEPRANVPYTLEVDGQEQGGVTDAEGNIDVRIPGNARHGKLILRRPSEQQARGSGQAPSTETDPNATEGADEILEEIDLHLGRLDPVDEVSGVQGRLRNLGYNPGGTDGTLGPRTRGALRRFQRDQELPETGEPDEQTQERLRALHGS